MGNVTGTVQDSVKIFTKGIPDLVQGNIDQFAERCLHHVRNRLPGTPPGVSFNLPLLDEWSRFTRGVPDLAQGRVDQFAARFRQWEHDSLIGSQATTVINVTACVFTQDGRFKAKAERAGQFWAANGVCSLSQCLAISAQAACKGLPTPLSGGLSRAAAKADQKVKLAASQNRGIDWDDFGQAYGDGAASGAASWDGMIPSAGEAVEKRIAYNRGDAQTPQLTKEERERASATWAVNVAVFAASRSAKGCRTHAPETTWQQRAKLAVPKTYGACGVTPEFVASHGGRGAKQNLASSWPPPSATSASTRVSPLSLCDIASLTAEAEGLPLYFTQTMCWEQVYSDPHASVWRPCGLTPQQYRIRYQHTSGGHPPSEPPWVVTPCQNTDHILAVPLYCVCVFCTAHGSMWEAVPPPDFVALSGLCSSIRDCIVGTCRNSREIDRSFRCVHMSLLHGELQQRRRLITPADMSEKRLVIPRSLPAEETFVRHAHVAAQPVQLQQSRRLITPADMWEKRLVIPRSLPAEETFVRHAHVAAQPVQTGHAAPPNRYVVPRETLERRHVFPRR